MCSATQWLATGAGLILCFLIPSRTVAEDNLWQKAFDEGKQLREQGRYAEAEKAHLLAVAEAEKFGPEDRRVAASLNNLAALYYDTGRLSEAESLYRRALALWGNFPSVGKSRLF
jgi:tetratricopeptide (TPR) repeat protein